MQEYKTIIGAACAEIEEKRSQFIANVGFADTEEKAVEFLDKIRTQHRTATHNVYAYCLRKGARMRYSDDGEPAKTAGLPILEVIKHSGLTDIIIVVTRYFGGTLLGTGGLVRAYTQAAQAGLAAAQIKTVCVCVKISLEIDYSLHDTALRLIEEANASLLPTEYADKVTLSFTMLNGTEQPLLASLSELTRGNTKINVSEPFYA